MESKNLRPLPSLTRKKHFQLLRSSGQKVYSADWLLLTYTDSQSSDVQLGLTVPKYIGNAVTRNRLKRWTREFFRLNKIVFGKEKGLHINIVFRRKDKLFYKNLSHEEFKVVIKKAVQKFKSKSQQRF